MFDRLEEIKKLNRDRQKRYYNAHKEKLLEKKKTIYQLGRELFNTKNEKELPNDSKFIPIDEQTHETPNETHDEPNIEPTIEPIQKSNNKKIIYDKEKTLEFLKQYNFASESTRKSYLNNCNMVFKAIPECTNIQVCLNKHASVIKNITELPYALNSKKAIYQTIVFLIDKLELKISDNIKNQYLDKFSEFKINSKEQTVEKQNDAIEKNIYPTFEEYLAKANEFYGKSSKEYLVAKMYQEIPIRDNFQLFVVSNSNSTQDTTKNFLVLPRSKGKLKIVLNTFKTEGKYKKQEYELSGELTKLLLEYIKTTNIKTDEPLFPKLSQFVSKTNKILGYGNHGGVGIYRHIAVSEGLNKISQMPKEKQTVAKMDLSKKLLHSVNTQSQYKRILTNNKKKK